MNTGLLLFADSGQTEPWLPAAVRMLGWGLVAAVAWVGLLGVAAAWNHRKRLRFFGLTHRNSRLPCYLSRMFVEKTSAREPITKGFTGPAMLLPEVIGAKELLEVFRTEQVLLPHAIAAWLARRGRGVFVLFGNVDTRIEISPSDAELATLPAGTLVSIGSQVYNSISGDYLGRNKYVEFGKDTDGVRRILIKSGLLTGTKFRVKDTADGKTQEQDVGVLLRINEIDDHSRSPRSLFICAGIGASASLASVRHLAQHWADLLAECGVDEFVGLVRLPGQSDRDSEKINDATAQFQLIHRCRQATLWDRLIGGSSSWSGKQ